MNTRELIAVLYSPCRLVCTVATAGPCPRERRISQWECLDFEHSRTANTVRWEDGSEPMVVVGYRMLRRIEGRGGGGASLDENFLL